MPLRNFITAMRKACCGWQWPNWALNRDAEDCVQEVFCNFWQHCLDRQSPFADINLEAYLVTSVKHYVYR